MFTNWGSICSSPKCEAGSPWRKLDGKSHAHCLFTYSSVNPSYCCTQVQINGQTHLICFVYTIRMIWVYLTEEQNNYTKQKAKQTQEMIQNWPLGRKNKPLSTQARDLLCWAWWAKLHSHHMNRFDPTEYSKSCTFVHIEESLFY